MVVKENSYTQMPEEIISGSIKRLNLSKSANRGFDISNSFFFSAIQKLFYLFGNKKHNRSIPTVQEFGALESSNYEKTTRTTMSAVVEKL